jgi:hypothetical protein
MMISRFRLDQLGLALAGFIMGVFSNALANWLVISNQPMQIFFFLLVLFSMLALILFKPVWRVRFGFPISLKTEQDCKRYARRGLIAFVSLYRQIRVPEQGRFQSAEIQRALDELDYRALRLRESTLEPVITAAASHGERLEHCWLISTSGPEGSEKYVDVLVEHLKSEEGLINCQFHVHGNYVVEPAAADDEMVRKVRDLVEHIFKEAKKIYKLSPKDVIADITSGFRSMSLGMTLSCLDASHDIELIGSEYDELARPIPPLTPMIFEFEIEQVHRSELQ